MRRLHSYMFPRHMHPTTRPAQTTVQTSDDVSVTSNLTGSHSNVKTGKKTGGRTENSNNTTSSRDNSPSKSIDENEGKAVLDENNFPYARLKGRGALITCLVDHYISYNKDYKKVVKDLKTDSSLPRAMRLILKDVVKLQKFCRIRLMAKAAWRYALTYFVCFHKKVLYISKCREGHRLLAVYIAETKMRASKVIKRLFLGWKARKSVVPLAQQMYVKCLDSDTLLPYWFNSRTEASFWVKPWLLREFDCGEAVMMPPEDEMCCAPCSVDNCPRTASVYCDQCDVILCQPCCNASHESGRSQQHHLIHLSLCAQCGFQLASRSCRSCGDYYCDSCFGWIHRKGRLRLHVGDWVCDRCDVCEERAAWWGTLDPERNYKTTLFCRVCFVKIFGPEDPLLDRNVFRVMYYGPSVQVQ